MYVSPSTKYKVSETTVTVLAVLSPSFYMFILISGDSLNESGRVRILAAAASSSHRPETCSWRLIGRSACQPRDEAPFHPSCQLESASAPPPPMPPLHSGGAADRCRSASDNRTDIMWKYRTMSPFFSADASRWLTAVRPESTLRLESDWIHAHTHTHTADTQRRSGVVPTCCVALVPRPPIRHPLRQQPAERPLELGYDTGGSAN